ncbi:methyltransferase family protein, partial [Nitrospinota bacterium]
ACGVLEVTAGTLSEKGLHKGEKVEVPETTEKAVKKGFWVNLVLAAFWFFLAVNMVPNLIAGEAGPSAYMLFAVNTLIAVLFLTRREEVHVTESSRDRLVTLVCILLSFSLRPAAGASLIPLVWESSFLTVSLLLVFAAYLNLGRSFGLIPADRGLKLGGLYGWVRHPLYGAEMLFFVSFLMANFTLRNFVFIVGIFLSLHMRALAEERLLARDPAYEKYCLRIRKRYIPYLV